MLVLSLLLGGISACSTGGSGSDLNYRVVTTGSTPAARPARTPVVVNASGAPAAAARPPAGPASASIAPPISPAAPQAPLPADASPADLMARALSVPAERQSVVIVNGTGGEGVWVRREPGGEPIRVWP